MARRYRRRRYGRAPKRRRSRRRSNGGGGLFGGPKIMGLGTNGILKMGKMGAVAAGVGSPMVSGHIPVVQTLPYRDEITALLAGGPAAAAICFGLKAVGMNPLSMLGAGGSGTNSAFYAGG